MPTFVHVLLARCRGFLRPSRLDREFREELESHLAMAEEEKVGRGMSREQARREARIELGGLTQLEEAGREARGLPWLDGLGLDVKLALRMARKSWGLTIVGGLAILVVVAVGVAVFAIADLNFGATLPLADGDRVVAVQTWDDAGHRRRDSAMEDVRRWRESLESLEDVGAFQTVDRSLVLGDGRGEPGPAEARSATVRVAEMSATGFDLARVEPQMGRALELEDETAGASPVVVIGHHAWRTRWAGDPNVLGRLVRLGDTVHTVVGVMPEGFAFPVNHEYWTALRLDSSARLADGDEDGVVFGRLRDGVELEAAGAEVASLGLLAESEPDEEIAARVVPYTFAFTGDFEPGEVRWVVRMILFLVALMLVPPCANIAILVYARTVSRQSEFAARFALGASRRRIVGQLFVEMLVISGAAAALALVGARIALAWLEASIRESMAPPFWMEFEISLPTVLFAAGLAVFAALVSSLVPALQASGRRMQASLRSLGNRAGMRLGTTWTVLVVAQVAVTVAALPIAVETGWGTVRQGVLGPGFAAEEFFAVDLALERELLGPDGEAIEVGGLRSEIVHRLETEPGIAGVAIVGAVPRREEWTKVDVEGAPSNDGFGSPSLVRTNVVDDRFFDLFEAHVVTGRTFEAAEHAGSLPVVVVNETFARQLLGEGNPLGRRIRVVPRQDSSESIAAVPEPWLEVVGVVVDRPAHSGRGTFYRPMTPGAVQPAVLAVRAEPGAEGVADRLREIARSVHPGLQAEQVVNLAEIYRDQQVGNNVGAFTLVLVTGIVLLLSAAGMYSLMSFTVNQRRREIGIRSALGAPPRQVLSGVFRRAAGQVALGGAVGIAVALVLDFAVPVELIGGWDVPGIIPGTALFMTFVAALAAAGPARRALRVQPIDELREG